MGPGKPTFLDLGSSITRRETHDWTPRATNCMPGSPNPGQVPGYSHLPAGLLSFSTPQTGQEAELQRDSLARNGLWFLFIIHARATLRSHPGSILMLREGVAFSSAVPTGQPCSG